MISIKFYLLFRRNFALFSFQKKKPDIGEKNSGIPCDTKRRNQPYQLYYSITEDYVEYTYFAPVDEKSWNVATYLWLETWLSLIIV